MERRLAAILAADIVGYSRLMATDEPGTLEAVKAHRKEFIEPKVAQHHGRIVKLMGDGGLAWWLERRTTPEGIESSQISASAITKTEDPVLAMPSGPAIAVLPFDNLSGDPEQEFFAEGLTEDIITRLARFTDLRVIARNTTFRYKGQPVDVRQIQDQLGARYVVEGSVRRSADALRVTAQLINAEDGANLWTETYNRGLSANAVFDVQDDITDRVVAAIASNWGAIAWHELEDVRSRPPESLASYDCVLLGHAYDRVVDEPSHLSALKCLERTVRQEPNYAEAWAWLSHIYSEQVWSKFNLRSGEDPEELALAAAQRALKIEPGNARAQAVLAFVYFWKRDREAFVKAAERALELNPNDTSILAEMALRLKGIGQWERSFALVNKAIALSPNPLPWYYFPLIHYYYYEKKYQQALAAVDKLGMPGNYWTYVLQAAIYGQLEERDKAEQAIAKLLELNPNYPPTAQQDVELWNWGAPDHVEHLLEGLRKAGLELPEATN